MRRTRGFAAGVLEVEPVLAGWAQDLKTRLNAVHNRCRVRR